MARSLNTIVIDKIDRGIPIPPVQRGVTLDGVRVQWNFKGMNVGDSFLVPDSYNIPLQKIVAAYTAHIRRNPLKGYAFSYRHRPEEEGVRVWRME